MNVFRLAGDLFHLLAIIILLLKIWKTKSCAGISGRSQILFALVYTARYLDIFINFISFYNSIMKVVFIGASLATLYLMYVKFKATYDRNHDTFRIEFLIIPVVILALVVNHDFSPLEVLWTFSIYLESVAILPQLFLLSITGVESIISCYLFFLGSYRGLYILNWVYRYYSEGFYDLIAIIAGIVQTVIYLNFFIYILLKKWLKKHTVLYPTISEQYERKCIKSDPLVCVICDAKPTAYDHKIGNYATYRACVEKHVSSLKDNHGNHCPWPLNPSPDNFVIMTLMSKEEALSQFKKRVEASMFFQTSFPKIKEAIISHLGLSDQQIMTLCEMAGVGPKEASRFGKSIVILCAMGWIITKDHESNQHVLKCKNCLRSAWCGTFSLLNSEDNLNKESESSEMDILNVNSDSSVHDISEENSDELPLEKKRTSYIIKEEPFDPLHEHQPWCLWIHYGIDSYIPRSKDNSAKNISNMPGWKIYLNSLLQNVSDNQASEVKCLQNNKSEM